MIPIRFAASVVLSTALLLTSSSCAEPHLAQAAPASSTSGLTVYLADFELDAVPNPLAAHRPANSRSPQQGDDEPSVQARRLVATLSLSLTEALKRAGYTVQSFPPASRRPDRGILLRGVFTEPDEYNRVRRSIHGSGSRSPKFVVYVGITNLARPDQPLYQLVPPNTPGFPVDSRFGPLITITSYSPVTSFELNRHPTDDDLRKLASDLTARLSSLVSANPSLTR